MVKRIGKFLLLKAVEIVGFYLLVIKCPLWLGKFIHAHTVEFWCLKHGTEEAACCPDWCIGFLSFCGILAVVALIGLAASILIGWIKKNWEWAGR